MRVPLDVDALQRVVQRNWAHQVQQISTSTTRLATGLRLVSAVDDAAGLALSQRDRSVSEGMRQAYRNIQDGIAYTRIGEGALSEMTAMMQRMRVLALQSANGTVSDEQRAGLQATVVMTLDEMDALVRRTESNRVRVFGGEPLTMQIGAHAGETLSIGRPETGATALGLSGPGGIDIGTREGSKSAIEMLDEALEALFEQRAEIAAAEKRMVAAARALAAQEAATRAAASRREDVDVAQEAGALAQATMLADVGAAMLAKVQQVQRGALELLRPLDTTGGDSHDSGTQGTPDTGSGVTTGGSVPAGGGAAARGSAATPTVTHAPAHTAAAPTATSVAPTATSVALTAVEVLAERVNVSASSSRSASVTGTPA